MKQSDPTSTLLVKSDPTLRGKDQSENKSIPRPGYVFSETDETVLASHGIPAFPAAVLLVDHSSVWGHLHHAGDARQSGE